MRDTSASKPRLDVSHKMSRISDVRSRRHEGASSSTNQHAKSSRLRESVPRLTISLRVLRSKQGCRGDVVGMSRHARATRSRSAAREFCDAHLGGCGRAVCGDSADVVNRRVARSHAGRAAPGVLRKPRCASREQWPLHRAERAARRRERSGMAPRLRELGAYTATPSLSERSASRQGDALEGLCVFFRHPPAFLLSSRPRGVRPPRPIGQRTPVLQLFFRIQYLTRASGP